MPAPTTTTSVVVAILCPGDLRRFAPTLQSLAHQDVDVVVVGGSREPRVGHDDLLYVAATDAAELVNHTWVTFRTHVLLLSGPVILPPHALLSALDIVGSDLRTASVSFLSNDASHASFPWAVPAFRPPEGHDERTVTDRLRSRRPDLRRTPIAAAVGAAVLFSATALSAVGPLRSPPRGSTSATLAEFSYRARRRGFVSILDPSTFVSTPSDLAVQSANDAMAAQDDERWVEEEHPFGPPLRDNERTDPESPLNVTIRAARTKVLGLRVLVDGSPLGPTQMGTQTTILALVESLAASDDIIEVGVVVRGEIPPYGAAVLTQRKVMTRRCLTDDFSALGHFDVAHRPFQPDQAFDARPWREASDRVIVSVLDLIGYQIGSYYDSPDTWMAYRRALRHAVAVADGVTVISSDVGQQMLLEHLSVDPERLFVVHYGTEHLTAEASTRAPSGLDDPRDIVGEYIVCLGTNYSHKNRDLAIAAWTRLRARGWNHRLVLVGAHVPFGSSRIDEAVAAPKSADIVVLPDVTDHERNWLLRHASLVLYPTSAEGFGLVPFEAAQFGTATVCVPFGPLLELGAAELPVHAKDWSPEALADAAERLLGDPAVARAQVAACLAAGGQYSWARAAAEFAAAYRTVVALPPRLPKGMAT